MLLLGEEDMSLCDVQGNMKQRVSPGKANEKEEGSSFSSRFRLLMSPPVGGLGGKKLKKWKCDL